MEKLHIGVPCGVSSHFPETNRPEAEATNLTYEVYEAVERHDKGRLDNIIADDAVSCAVMTKQC
jgi:hypothetical protein